MTMPTAPMMPQQMPTGAMPPVMPFPADPRETYRRARRDFAVAGASLCVMVAAWIGLEILASQALSALLPGRDLPLWATLLASSGPLYAVAMPLGMIALSRVPMLRTRRFPLGAGEFLSLLVICIPVIAVGNLLGTGLSALLSHGQAENRLDDLFGGSAPVVILFTVVLAPLVEEWMFRRQLIGRLRTYGERTALVFSALAFALFHMNLYQFFYAFGLGIVLGYAYLRTSRLRYSVAIHMIINANGAVVAPWVLSQIPQSSGTAGAGAGGGMSGGAGASGGAGDGGLSGTLGEPDAGDAGAAMGGAVQMTPAENAGLLLVGAYGLVMMGLLIAGIVVLIVRWRRRVFYPTPAQLPAGWGARAMVANPGVIVYLVLTIVLGLFMTLVG